MPLLRNVKHQVITSRRAPEEFSENENQLKFIFCGRGYIIKVDM